MKRLHVNIGVTGIDDSVRFYSTLFAAETEAELAEVFSRAAATGGRHLDEGTANCCYARSTKQWVQDPQGVHWEAFLTHERTAGFGHSPDWRAPPRRESPVRG